MSKPTTPGKAAGAGAAAAKKGSTGTKVGAMAALFKTEPPAPDKAPFQASTICILNHLSSATLSWELTTMSDDYFTWRPGTATSATPNGGTSELFHVQRDESGKSAACEVFHAAIRLKDGPMDLPLSVLVAHDGSGILGIDILLNGVTQTAGWIRETTSTSFTIPGTERTLVIHIGFSWDDAGYEDIRFTFAEVGAPKAKA